MDIGPEKLVFETKIVGRKVVYFPTANSTMEEGRRLGLNGAEDGTVVIAGEQTSGRGRRKRPWISPRGSLAVSVILRPPSEDLPQLVMLASLAANAAIKAATGLSSGIKWPNDILINGKKVCGILIENHLSGNQLEFTVIGIGINVNIDILSYPEIAEIATSLSAEVGKPVSGVDILRQLISQLDRTYLEMKSGINLYLRWREQMIILGHPVKIIEEGHIEQGIAEDVDPDGSLLLRRSDGNLARILAGDVSLRQIPL